jgi:protein SCO1
MKNKQAWILMLVLVAPVLLYLFLLNFGENQFKLPKYIPQIDSTSGEIKIVNGDTIFRQVPAFSFIDQNNKPVNQSLTKGKIYVANFFFARCGTICPKMSSQLTRVQEAFKDHSDVLLLSHTVDPQNDTPAVLKEYAKRYEAIGGKWFFLTGDKKALYDMAIKGYFVPVSDASEYDKMIKNIDEAFIHSEKLILIDKEGYMRGFYDGTDKKEIDRLILEIKILEDIYKKM